MYETARLCEILGVKTVILASGSVGSDARAESAGLMNIKEVDAIVMTGGGVEYDVPAAERMIASNAVMAEQLGAPQKLSAMQVGGVVNQQGGSHLASIVY
jgi:hypothetical protein